MSKMLYDVEQFANILRASNLFPEQNELSDEELVSSFVSSNPSYKDYIQNIDTVPPTETSTQEIEPAQSSAQSYASVKYGDTTTLTGGPSIGEDLRFVGYQFQQQWHSTPSSLVGGAAWLANLVGADSWGESLTNMSEEMRREGNQIMADIVNQDEELAGYLQWMEDEPVTLQNWWHLDMLQRGLAQAAPSIMEMTALSMATGGVGFLAGAARGAKIATSAMNKAKVIVGITGMSGMEGSSQYNEAMGYLVDEKGYDPKIANKIAGASAALYAPVSGALEYLPFMGMMKRAGLGSLADKQLIRSITGQVERNLLGGGLSTGVYGAITEGATEWSQYMAQAFINELVVNNPDRPLEESFDKFAAEFKEHATSPEAIESLYSGMVMGKSMGFVTGAAGAHSKTPENIAKRIRRNEDWIKRQIEKGEFTAEQGDLLFSLGRDEFIEDATKGMKEDEKESFVERIKTAWNEQTDESEMVEEEEYGEDILPEATEGDALFNEYLGRLFDEGAEDFRILGPLEEDADPLLLKIKEDQQKKTGDKILSLIEGNPENLEKILSLEDEVLKRRILGSAIYEFKKQFPNLKVDKDITQEDAISKLKLFATKGKQVSVKESGLGGGTTKEIRFDLDSLTEEEQKELEIQIQDPTELETGDVVEEEKDITEELKKEEERKIAETTTETELTGKKGEELTPEEVQAEAERLAEEERKRIEKATDEKTKSINPEVFEDEGDESEINLQDKMTKKIEEVANKSAKKYVPKEQVKTKIATQFIGEGKKNSSTDKYRGMYEDEGLANTGDYKSDDVVFVASNGKRMGGLQPVSEKGELQGQYKNIDKAIDAGATIVMDNVKDANRPYNTGEQALAKYLEAKGYEREGKSGIWKPGKAEAKPEWLTPEAHESLRIYGMSDKDINSLTKEEAEGIIGVEVSPISATKGVDVMRGSKWGNPFIVPEVYDKNPDYYKKQGFLRANSTEDAIQSYEDWIQGTAHQGFQTEKRDAIIAGLKSGELKGQTLKYFKPNAADSHAVRLAKLVAQEAPAEDTDSAGEAVGKTVTFFSQTTEGVSWSDRKKGKTKTVKETGMIIAVTGKDVDGKDIYTIKTESTTFEGVGADRVAFTEILKETAPEEAPVEAKPPLLTKEEYAALFEDPEAETEIPQTQYDRKKLPKTLVEYRDRMLQSMDRKVKKLLAYKEQGKDESDKAFEKRKKSKGYKIAVQGIEKELEIMADYGERIDKGEFTIEELNKPEVFNLALNDMESMIPTGKEPTKEKSERVKKLEEKKKKLEQQIKDGLNELNVGLNPKQMKLAIELGAINLELGARSFADWSAKMVEGLGDWIKDYLKMIYSAMRYNPDIPAEHKVGMSPDSELDMNQEEEGKTTYKKQADGTEITTEYDDYLEASGEGESTFIPEIKIKDTSKKKSLDIVEENDKGKKFLYYHTDDKSLLERLKNQVAGDNTKYENETGGSEKAIWGDSSIMLTSETDKTHRDKLGSNVLEVEIKQEDFVSIDADMTILEIFDYLVELGYDMSNTEHQNQKAIEAGIEPNDPRLWFEENDGVDAETSLSAGGPLAGQRELFQVLQRGNPGLAGIKIINHRTYAKGEQRGEGKIQAPMFIVYRPTRVLDYKKSTTNLTRDEINETLPTVISNDQVEPKDAGNRKITLTGGKVIVTNNQQHSAIESFVSWMSEKASGAKGFILSGFAGTGKSTIVKEMLREAKSKGLKVELSALTHKAAGVLRRMVGEDTKVSTLHSMLGVKGNRNLENFDISQTKFFINLNKKSFKDDKKYGKLDILVIDEVSMMSEQIYKLLMKIAEDNNFKILFSGDVGQIQPVGETVSPVFKDEIKKNSIFHELTTVERVSAGNPILELVTAIRTKLWAMTNTYFSHTSSMKDSKGNDTNDISKFSKGVNFEDRVKVFVGRAVSLFKAAYDGAVKGDGNFVKIIAYTNNQVAVWNSLIRDGLYGKNAPQIVKGEKLSSNITILDPAGDGEVLVAKSIDYVVLDVKEDVSKHGIERWVLKVQETTSPEENRNPPVKTIRIIKGGVSTKQDWKTRQYPDMSEGEKKAAKIAEELWWTTQKAKTEDEKRKAENQYDEFKEEHLTMRAKGLQGSSKQGYSQEPSISYGYAVTVHKSQGSTYKNVLVDDTSIEGVNEAGIANATSGWRMKGKQSLRDFLSLKEWTDGMRTKASWPGRSDELTEFHWIEANKLRYVAYSRASDRVFSLTSKLNHKVEEVVYRDNTKETNVVPEKQEIGASGMQTVSEAKAEAKKIAESLSKKFPFIDVEALEKVIVDGKEYAGTAINLLVQWSKSKATLDTVPHEYAHIYVKIMGNSKVVQQGIEIFGSEEALVQHMGEYYVKRMLGEKGKPKIATWLKKFWLTMKSYFKKISPEEVGDLLGETFFKAELKGADYSLASNHREFQEVSQNAQTNETESRDNNSLLGKNPNTVHIQYYFENLLGIHIKRDHHPQLIKIAHSNVDNFNAFAKEIDAFFVQHYGKSIWEEEGNIGAMPTQELNQTMPKFLRGLTQQYRNNFRYLHDAWHRWNSRIHIMDYNNVQNGGRVIFEAIETVTKGVVGYQLGHIGKIPDNTPQGKEKRKKKDGRYKRNVWQKVNEFFVKNFVEEDPNAKIRTVYLSQKDISYLFTPSNSLGFAEEFYIQSNRPIDDKSIKAIDVKLSNWKMVFVGSKGGSNSSMLLARIPEEYIGYTEEQFIQYLNDEIKAGNFGKDKDKQEALKRDFLIDAKTRKINGISQPYAQVIGKHEWWKQTKYNKYLLGTHIGVKGSEIVHSIRDFFNRLRIDFAEGYFVRGLGKSSIMTLPPDTKVYVKTNRGEESVGTMDDYDGWLITSGRFMGRLTQQLGKTTNINLFKGVIRYRSSDGENYIGTKSMMMKPHKNMVFRDRDGNLVARITGSGMQTKILDANGNETEFLGSTNEIKQTSGRFSDFGTIQELPENFLKVNFFPEKSKETSAFPVTWSELALDAGIKSEELEKYLDRIFRDKDSLYKEMALEYINKFREFTSDPKSLRDFLYRKAKDGEISIESQRYLEMLGENGEGVHYPHILKMFIPNINSLLITNGLYKGRPFNKGEATQLYYKPKVSFDVKQGDVFISWNNKVVRNYVIKKYAEGVGLPEKVIRNRIKIHGANAIINPKDTDVWMYQKATKDGGIEDRAIPSIRTWLSTNDVQVPILASRIPVAKLTGVRLMNIRGIVEGEHGETVFMHNKDILEVFDGDWDGDKGMFYIIKDEKTIEALREYQDSQMFKDRDKSVDVKLFFTRYVAGRVSNYKDLVTSVKNMSIADGTQGLMQNAKQIISQLGHKQLKLVLSTLDGVVVPYNNTDIVIMNYVRLNKNYITEDVYNGLIKQGDSIVGKDGKEVDYKTFSETPAEKAFFYLKTTKEHELSILLQMSVDDAKFGLIGQIGLDNDFIVKKLFKNITSKGVIRPITDEAALRVLKEVKKLFNLSPQRHGYTSGGNKKSMTLAENLAASKKLYEKLIDPNLGETIKETINFIALGSKLDFATIENITINSGDRHLTGVEVLLTELGKLLKRNNKDKDAVRFKKYNNEIPFKVNDTISIHAKIKASVILNENLLNDSEYDSLSPKEQNIAKANAMDYVDKMWSWKDGIQKILMTIYDKKGEPINEETNDAVLYDRNEEFAKVADKMQPFFNNLSPLEKKLATIYFLRGYDSVSKKGKPTTTYKSLVLPPLNLVDKGTLQDFFKIWWEQVKSINSPKDLISSEVYETTGKQASLYEKGVTWNKVNKHITKKTERMCNL